MSSAEGQGYDHSQYYEMWLIYESDALHAQHYEKDLERATARARAGGFLGEVLVTQLRGEQQYAVWVARNPSPPPAVDG